MRRLKRIRTGKSTPTAEQGAGIQGVEVDDELSNLMVA